MIAEYDVIFEETKKQNKIISWINKGIEFKHNEKLSLHTFSEICWVNASATFASQGLDTYMSHTVTFQEMWIT